MKNLLHIIIGLVFVLLVSTTARHAHAQAPFTLDPAKAPTQYVHQIWQIDEGLPQTTVRVIVQTQDGYLWMGTEEGLVRFDGVRFQVFDKSNTAAFETGDSVLALVEDRAGDLWIGTGGGSLVRYTDGRFVRYGRQDGLPGEGIKALVEDRVGDLWIGTLGSGLFSYRNGHFVHYRSEDGLSGDLVTTLLQDRDGALWAGTSDGVTRIKNGSSTVFRHVDSNQDNFVLTLHEDRNGVVWVGTRQGLSRVEGAHLAPCAHDVKCTPAGVRALWEDIDGNLWVGLDQGGLGRLRGGRYEAFSTEDGLSHGRVLALLGDREGSLWIGTEGGGLNRLHDGKFTTYTTRENLSHNIVLTVHEDADGALWIGTDGGGLNRLHDGALTVFTTADGLSSNIITSVYADRSGALWAGTIGQGLNRLRDGAITTFTTADGLPSASIYALTESRNGDLWIGTDAGLARFSDGAITTFTTVDGLSSNLVTALYEDHQGDLWIGTFDAGFSRFRGGRFTHFTTADGLGSPTVLALYEDPDHLGAIWIGTYEGGLSRLRDGALTTYTTKDGLFSDDVYQILEDEDENLWMSCNKGLFSISKDDLAAFDQGFVDRITSTVYGKADGLKNAEFNGGSQPAGWKRSDGTLWFPSMEGVVMIDPQRVRRNTQPPPVVIEEVLIDYEPIAYSDGTELGPGKKKIEFRYTALSFIAPEAIRFEFFLEGYDEAWQKASARRTATYTNLPPGSYTFHVKARNSDGVWNETGASVALTLKPFFYQTGWFFALIALALFVSGVLGYKARTQQLRRRKRELEALVETRTHDLRKAKEKIETQAEKLNELHRFKDRFFANVSHEFRTPLTMIIGPLENALQGTYGALSAPVHRQAEIMLRNALRLMRLINQLLDLSKLEAGKMLLRARPRNVVPFLEGVVLSCSAFAEQKHVDLRFESKSDTLAVFFEPDKLEKVFFNLLSNAVKFTPAGGEIIMTVTEQPATPDFAEGALEVRVRDTGIGIPPEDLPHIFDRFRQVDTSNIREHEGAGIGLALARELVLLHHGVIHAYSEVGVGTEFVVTMPLGAAHLSPEEQTSGRTDEEPFELGSGALTELAFSALSFMPEPAPSDVPERAIPDEAPLILVVEDNADVREYVASILNRKYHIEMAEDGEDGLEKARQCQPDLIVSDVMMPKMDGTALCRAVKSDPTISHIPVVLMTARATQQMKIEGLEVGADDYLAKPFNARELMVRAKNLIQIRQQKKELKRLKEGLERKVEDQVQTILHDRIEYEKKLLAAKEQAEQSLQIKTTILDNMNHEFRTPVATIRGYAQIIAGEVEGGLQEFADVIDQSGARLMRTLDAVQQLSRLEADDLDLNPAALNLVQAVREAQKRFAPMAVHKGLALRLKTPPAERIDALLDAAAIERVLDYLIDNAIKFTDEGEVVLDVERQADTVTLSVRDTGVGIDEAFLPHLFKAFTQESTGLTRSHDGIGIGLTVAHRLVDLLDGSIAVESEKGRGSVFTVTFPAAASPRVRQIPARMNRKQRAS